MQAKQSTTRTDSALKHPGTGEWMEFLYGEATAQRKRALETHLAGCADCAAQLKLWQGSARSLDAWALPPATRVLPSRARFWRWAAAAALVLLAGFWISHQIITSRAELAALKTSVAQLNEIIQRGNAATFSNSVVAATSAANQETLRLLADYSRVQEARQSTDLETLGLALADFKTSLARLRAELETVAVNTENGFEQTHESLDRVVAISTRQPEDTGNLH